MADKSEYHENLLRSHHILTDMVGITPALADKLEDVDNELKEEGIVPPVQSGVYGSNGYAPKSKDE